MRDAGVGRLWPAGLLVCLVLLGVHSLLTVAVLAALWVANVITVGTPPCG